MKICRYEKDGEVGLGRIDGDSIVPLIGDFASAADPMIAFIENGERAADGAAFTLDEARLLAPIVRPGKIWAIALNYQDHVDESGLGQPEQQVWFTKATTAIAGPTDTLQIPAVSPHVDYEAEMVAVIGKRCKHVAREDAASVIFGYCVGNDVTERHWQHRVPQWSLGKSFDTHAPIGPWITTADEIADPHALDISCEVNGEVRQSSNTRHLIFDIYEQIEHLSAAMTLEPGDLIFTGTPGGVGVAMKPMVFLKAGDVVRCEIEQLGAIENPFAKEDATVAPAMVGKD